MAYPTTAVNALPTNIDASNDDDPTDATVKAHQQYHDTVHVALQEIPASFAPLPSGTPTTGQVPAVTTVSPLALGWTTPAAGASYTDEQAQDAAAALFTNGTHSGITFTYDDTAGAVNSTVGVGYQPWQFPVEKYGAVGDGTTDDTAAVNAAVAAAVTYAQAHRQFAEVLFQAKTYLLSGAPTKTATNKGNAQIPLPIVDGTAAKVTLVFRGVGDTAALPHWLQNTAQAVGAVLKTTRADGYDNTYGWASVIGGPAYEQGYGTTNALFTNLCVVIDGITVQVPRDPAICGVDLCGVAECNIVNLGVQTNTTPANAVTTTALSSFAFGLRMPYTGNNAYCEIGQFSVEGFKRGAILGEHTRATSIRAIYCDTGVAFAGPAPHAISIQRACIEQGSYALEYIGITPSYLANNNGLEIAIGDLDLENISLVSDFGNKLYGHVQYNNGGVGYGLVGGANCKWTNLGIAPGAKTAPAVPATTVALTNPFERDCAVSISGGTVTGVAVDGTTLGVTSGTVFVPSQKTITLTYSAAPTWKWIAL